MNRTLMESARAMMTHAGLSNAYWAEAIATAAYLRNRTTMSALKSEVTPYEKWYERKPEVSYLKVFGCVSYAHIPDSKDKVGQEGTKIAVRWLLQECQGLSAF